MIEEINKRYGGFHDAIISNISYSRSIENESIIEITLSVMSLECVYENIKILLSEISYFRFIEKNYSSSLIINGVVLVEEEGVITLDFFPEISASGYTITEDSDFLIRCKHISYEVI